MSVESLSNKMDASVVEGMGSPLSMERTQLIEAAAFSAPTSELELSSVKTSAAKAIENLDAETGSMFPEKEDTAAVEVEENKEITTAKDLSDKSLKESKLILGMKPLTFGILALAVGVGGYLAYKKFGKK